MNRHRIAELAAAAAEYRRYSEHRERLIAAINRGRIVIRPLRVFGARPREWRKAV